MMMLDFMVSLAGFDVASALFSRRVRTEGNVPRLVRKRSTGLNNASVPFELKGFSLGTFQMDYDELIFEFSVIALAHALRIPPATRLTSDPHRLWRVVLKGGIMNKLKNQKGAIGWILLWLLGIPIPILLLFFLVRGCT